MKSVFTPFAKSRRKIDRFVQGLLGYGAVCLGALFTILHASGYHPAADAIRDYVIPIGVALLGGFYMSLVFGQDRIRHEIAALQSLYSGPSHPLWAHSIRESLPPDLWNVIAPEMKHFIEGLSLARNEGKVRIRKESLRPRFFHAYIDTLTQFSESTFCSMALATKRYWSIVAPEAAITAAYTKFLRTGHMKRIFLIENPLQPSTEECRIMQVQSELGVKVYIASRHSVSSMEMERMFFVEQPRHGEPRVAWELETGGDEVKAVIAVFNPQEAQVYLKIWNELVDLGVARPVESDELRRLMDEATKRAAVVASQLCEIKPPDAAHPST